jgi:hypothetical protein
MTMVQVAWTAIGLLAVAVLGMFGMMFQLSARIDALGARLDARIDALGARLDARIDALSDRVDALAAVLQDHIKRHAG